MHWSVSQVIYCGGFSSVDPPLSIPNREVKRTYADGTDRPVGRVGSRRSSDPRTKQFARGSFFVPGRPGAQRRCVAPPGSRPPRLFPSATGKGQVRAARKMASRYLHSPSAGPPLAAAFPACGQIFLGFSARTAPPCPAHYRCAVATLIFRGVSVAHIGDGAKRFKRLNFQRPPLEAPGWRFAVKNTPFNPRQFTAHPHRTPSVALPCSKS